MEKQYPVVEIFHSIQGEGVHVGIPATFIRLAGCNLRCEWCDTKISWDDSNANTTSASDIEAAIQQNTVIITGGEPCLHDLNPLLMKIKEDATLGRKVFIETNGTYPINKKDGVDWVTCSPKPKNNYIMECVPDELKYVVDKSFDVAFVPEIYKFKIPIWLQPNFMNLKESLKKAYKLAMENDFLRLGFQIHKFYDFK